MYIGKWIHVLGGQGLLTLVVRLYGEKWFAKLFGGRRTSNADTVTVYDTNMSLARVIGQRTKGGFIMWGGRSYMTYGETAVT